jgi:mono/diheme cytochrome c family protein
MKARGLAATGIALALSAAAGLVVVSAPSDARTTIQAADDFRLVDQTGYAHELRRLVDVKAIVVVAQVNGDTGSRKAAKALEALKASHPDVEFMMMNSTPGVSRAEVAAEVAAQGYTIPVMHDRLQLAGDQLGVTYAGEAFVIEPKTLKVLYRGPVDAAGAKKKAKGYLAEALADVKAGSAVKISEVKGKGASIAFPERARSKQHAKISYASDVAPILEAKCVACHQEGGIGPFAMNSYETVKGFAPMIRESVRTGRMPPWHPDPEVGEFKHDAGLSDAETRTLIHWIEAGAARGEGADPLAAQAKTAPEWPLGEPDLVLEVPTYQIPASGMVEYQYPAMANPLTEGRWVKAATLLPGDRRGVHHILAGYISGTPRTGPASQGQWEANYGEYAVGGESFNVPADMGIYLPPGGSMGFQMHYTPYGVSAPDTSKMGLYFLPKGETPKRALRHMVTADNMIEIAPNTPHHKEIAYSKFTKDAVIYSAFLHTHYRGISGSLELVKPDGSREMLINLPRYDFNWQRTYDFAKPVNVPAGSKLVSTYFYDNSVRNASNPDPNATVYWGDQSWEEMHYTSFYYEWVGETAEGPAGEKQLEANAPFRPYRLMGMLDDNLDEKVQLSELKGLVRAAMEPRFAEFDKNADGALDNTELSGATNVIMSIRRPDAVEPKPNAS